MGWEMWRCHYLCWRGHIVKDFNHFHNMFQYQIWGQKYSEISFCCALLELVLSWLNSHNNSLFSLSSFVIYFLPKTMIHLSICKDGGVVALKATLNQLLGAGSVDGILLWVHVEYVVVGEGLVFAQHHLRFPGHHICADVTSLYLFSGQLRTNPSTKTRHTLRKCTFSM